MNLHTDKLAGAEKVEHHALSEIETGEKEKTRRREGHGPPETLDWLSEI